MEGTMDVQRSTMLSFFLSTSHSAALIFDEAVLNNKTQEKKFTQLY